MKQSDDTTVIAPGAWTHVLVWAGFSLLGAGAGWLVKLLAGWVQSLTWVPFEGPLELIDSLPEPQATIGAIGIGAVAGLVVAAIAESEMLRVSISDDDLVIGTGAKRPPVTRASTTTVFVDGKDLVLLGRRTEELLRVKVDMDRGDVEHLGEALRSHGWPWRADGDPYQGDYRRWVEGTPELSPGINAIFVARQHALDRGDKDDAAQLRDELAKFDVVVRDENKRQFWRHAAVNA